MPLTLMKVVCASGRPLPFSAARQGTPVGGSRAEISALTDKQTLSLTLSLPAYGRALPYPLLVRVHLEPYLRVYQAHYHVGLIHPPAGYHAALSSQPVHTCSEESAIAAYCNGFQLLVTKLGDASRGVPLTSITY